jgi:hypothetical protein
VQSSQTEDFLHSWVMTRGSNDFRPEQEGFINCTLHFKLLFSPAIFSMQERAYLPTQGQHSVWIMFWDAQRPYISRWSSPSMLFGIYAALLKLVYPPKSWLLPWFYTFSESVAKDICVCVCACFPITIITDT